MSSTAKPKTTTPSKNGLGKFINYSLSDEQRTTLKNLPYEPRTFVDDLDRISNSGYKVSFSWDDYSNGFACFWTQKDPKHENAGFVLTARGSTTLKAFKQAMFLHFEIFGGLWADYYERPIGREIDD